MKCPKSRPPAKPEVLTGLKHRINPQFYWGNKNALVKISTAS